MSNQIKVGIIEDDKTVNNSLVMALDMQVMMTLSFNAFSVEEGLKHLESGQVPDVLLLDIGLPGMTGIEGIPHIKKQSPNTDIIMLTTYDDSERIFAALCAGACSYLSKKSPLKMIMESIFTVARGGSFMSPSIARKIANHFQPKRSQALDSLSERQMEIVVALADGLTYNEIAEKLFVSINTIRTHIKRIYVELEINSKMKLINLYNNS